MIAIASMGFDSVVVGVGCVKSTSALEVLYVLLGVQQVEQTGRNLI